MVLIQTVNSFVRYNVLKKVIVFGKDKINEVKMLNNYHSDSELSRKVEGLGPEKPWQPTLSPNNYQGWKIGANSYHVLIAIGSEKR